jgi:hypothetical protein
VLAGHSVPQGSGPDARPLVDGAPAALQPEIAAGDLAVVKVRYKPVTAASAEATAALEVRAALPAAEVQEGLGSGDPDLRWAMAIAAFAEILKQSPFADRALLPTIAAIIDEQAARDADRRELAELFAKARPRLGGACRGWSTR